MLYTRNVRTIHRWFYFREDSRNVRNGEIERHATLPFQLVAYIGPLSQRTIYIYIYIIRVCYLVVEAAILSQTNKLLYDDYTRFSRIDLSPNTARPRARLPIKVETVVRNTSRVQLVYTLMYPLSYRFYICICIHIPVPLSICQ